MMRSQLILCILALCTCGSTHAQEPREGFDAFVELIADVVGDDAEEEWGSEQMEDLYEMYCHPLNLNHIDEGQLSQLPFLTQVQVGDIVDYAERHRPMLSTGELMSLSTLDYTTRRLLQLFTYAGDVPAERLTFRDLLQHSHSDLTLRTDIPLYTRMGYADYPASVLAASPNKVYRGSQPYLSARYSLESMNHLEAGFQLEKDPGESGVDYWAAYALMRHVGPVDVLAVGDYRLMFGHGLVVNTSSGFGKTMMLSNVERMDRGIRRHSSMQESGYLSGVATTLRLGSWQLSAFFSQRHADGTLLADGSGVSSVKTDGLHRTFLEYNKRGNLTKTDWGGNVSWQGSRLRLSATAVHTRFSLPLRPKHDTPASYYRLYNADGTDFTAYSLAYRYVAQGFTLSGETASTADGGIATLNMLQTELGTHRLTLIQRYYSADYVSINGKTFSANSRPQNESGVYLGWQHPLSRRLRVEAYIDAMYFPWLKYQVSQSSYAFEAMAQLTYTPSDVHLWSLRYRLRTKELDWKLKGITQPVLQQQAQHTARLMHVYEPSSEWRLKSLLQGTLVRRDDTGCRVGWGLSETLSWQRLRWLRLSAMLTYFHTDDWSTRLYTYEPSLLYTFGMSALYDEGVRAALLATVRLPHRLSLLAKIGSTHYFRSASIGTGPDLIPQSHREDLQLQLNWQF